MPTQGAERTKPRWRYANEDQRDFVLSSSFFNIFDGGMGSGKTNGLCRRALRVSELNAPAPYLLISPTYPNQQRSVLPTLWEVLEESRLDWVYRKSARVVELPDFGGEIWLATAENPDKNLRGPNVGAAGIDETEQVSYRAFELTVSRVRHKLARMPCIDCSTTPEGFTWLHEEIQKPWEGGVFHRSTSTRRNPFNPAHYVRQLEQAFDPVLAQAYIEGKRVNLTMGQVYHRFDRKVNIRPCPYNPALPLEAWIDFNVDPMACVLIQPGSAEELHGVGEVLLFGSDSVEMGEHLAKKLVLSVNGKDVRPSKPPLVYCDPTGTARSHQTGKSDVQALKAAGLAVRYPARGFTIREGVNLVNAALMDSTGKARLYFDPSCEATIRALEGWANREGTRDPEERSSFRWKGRNVPHDSWKMLYYGLLGRRGDKSVAV